MKTQKQWFSEYAVSHQIKTNQLIHYICVPAIFFSIVGLLMSIPSNFIQSITKLNLPLIENWATIVLVLLLFFYASLSISTFIKMLLFGVLCIVGNFYLSYLIPLIYISLFIFVIAWIGQFYGHKIEGKKPSFLKDLQFLLIGPAWVFEKLTK
ncbi:Mpo1-like protein [Lutibacter sp. TH_r2]|uniref:Mpo1 family 2-hydroxy fatty acid dioxygenase n=1 Tax=Lutibacter sp. TH_r2 TaxID=3082083 RepID=UPI0029544286|nr:Mpo1-like protein [Lutibacter sp. TH_r2]MDV7187383.1 Mpo1-like protein [Lutibacter sp. TH_r2]